MLLNVIATVILVAILVLRFILVNEQFEFQSPTKLLEFIIFIVLLKNSIYKTSYWAGLVHKIIFYNTKLCTSKKIKILLVITV